MHNRNFDLYRAKREFAGFMAVVFGFMTVAGMLSNLILSVSAVRDAGHSFFEYLQISGFGFMLLNWDYNSIWFIVSIVLFVGGFLGFIATANKR